jgi:hypothetical protein
MGVSKSEMQEIIRKWGEKWGLKTNVEMESELIEKIFKVFLEKF